MRGLFITFEGIDGCGKSTQHERAAKRLRGAGYNVMTTREPGGTVISEKIRSIIIDPSHKEMCNECELLLYAASRAQHVREKILPAVEAGVMVISDRFDLATFAYQGFGRGIDFSLLKTINDIATQGAAPDLTFIFDISPENAFARIAAMNKPSDRLESGGKEFYSRVCDGYRSLARQDSEKNILLDAMKSVKDLEEIVMERILAGISASLS